MGSVKRHDYEFDVARTVQAKQRVSRTEDAMVVRVMPRESRRGTEFEEQENGRERDAALLFVSLVLVTEHATGKR